MRATAMFRVSCSDNTGRGLKTSMSDDEADYYPDANDDADERLEELEQRIETIESGSGRAGIGLLYGLGMAISVVLSWSRNYSILWCILHGLLSWVYVIYFAFSR